MASPLTAVILADLFETLSRNCTEIAEKLREFETPSATLARRGIKFWTNTELDAFEAAVREHGLSNIDMIHQAVKTKSLKQIESQITLFLTAQIDLKGPSVMDQIEAEIQSDDEDHDDAENDEEDEDDEDEEEEEEEESPEPPPKKARVEKASKNPAVTLPISQPTSSKDLASNSKKEEIKKPESKKVTVKAKRK